MNKPCADDWQPIETAPEDCLVLVWASPRDDLPGFVTIAKWNEWAGWCVDELRDTTHWRPLPEGPADDAITAPHELAILAKQERRRG